MHKVKVAFGYESSGIVNEDPEAVTPYCNLITFDADLVKKLCGGMKREGAVSPGQL